MATVDKLCVGILTALALCKYCLAEWNVTDQPANRTVSQCHHGNGDNCTDQQDTDSWNTHFSECPKELEYYCVHGDCRYVEEQKAPSCRCQNGYIGSRCEYVHLQGWTDKNQHIIISCIIAVLVVLILIIITICICSQRRLCQREGRRRDGEPRNGTEKLSMMDTSAANTSLTPDSTETSAV